MSRQKKIKWLRGIVVAVAAVLVCSQTEMLKAATISSAQKEKEGLQSDLEDVKELVNSLNENRQDTEESIAVLDQKLTEISGRIEDLRMQTEQKETEIAEAEAALEQAQQEEIQQYEDMKKRIRYMYESYGSMNYITLLFSCSSFSEYLNQAQYMYQISQYDRLQLEKYQETVSFVEETKESLEQDKEQLLSMKAQVEEDKSAVDLLMAEKEQQLNSINADLSEAEIREKEIQAEIAAQEEIIAQIQAAEKKRKEEEARKATEEKKQESTSSGSSGNIDNSNAYTGGVFTWPCPASTRVTSDFGYRTSPTAGASSYHNGIDIGAPYGSGIVAAADGTVFNVAYQANGAGNYVVVSHGGGVYTVYMHCSSVAVSAGQQVTRGQVIAYVGSTGISTGNHLHFGVQVNGSYVNPWNYLK